VNCSHSLAETPLVRVFRYDHPADEAHRDPSSELSDAPAVNFVESGSFELTVERRRWALSPATVFLTRPGVKYRYRHAEELPSDVCLSVRYSPELGAEALGGGNGNRRTAPVRRLTNRLSYLRWRLLRSCAAAADTLETESIATDLLRAASGEAIPARRSYRTGQLAWYAERIDRVRGILEERYIETPTLAELAREAGMSVFHMARTFHDLVGASPHRYLVDIRLERAAERLRAGASVTPTCYAVGFADLSHFIRMFSRRFGVSPSRFPR
jgi:AraC family transcriptional regulator